MGRGKMEERGDRGGRGGDLYRGQETSKGRRGKFKGGARGEMGG